MRKIFVVFTILVALTRPAAAQWAVIDSSNLQQNMMNTISTFTQEYQQVQQYVTQLQQLQYEYMQLKGLGSSDVAPALATVTEELNTQRAYQAQLANLYGDLNSAKTVTSNLYARMAASGLSDADWMVREAERNKATQDGNGFLTNYEANVLSQVGTRYNQVQQLQDKIVTTEGTHEAMQIMNTQMNMLLGTTNQMLENNALLAQRALNRDTEQAGRDKARIDGADAYYKAVAASRKLSTSEIEKIK